MQKMSELVEKRFLQISFRRNIFLPSGVAGLVGLGGSTLPE